MMNGNILKKFVNILTGFLISAIFIVLILHQIDIKQVFELFNHMKFMYFLLIVFIYIISFIVKIFRWKVILSPKLDLKSKYLTSAMFIGYMANTLLPAKMGEIYRAHYLGKKENLKRTKVFASIVLERIFDGSILFFTLLIFLIFMKANALLSKIALFTGFLFIGSYVFLFLLSKYLDSNTLESKKDLFLTKIKKYPTKIKNFLTFIFNKTVYTLQSFNDGLEVLHSLKAVSLASACTIFVWFLEAVIVLLLAMSLGVKLTLLSSILVVCIVVFSTVIPSGPASIGPFQFGYIIAFNLLKLDKESAIAISLLHQLIPALIFIIGGTYYILKDHININELETISE